MAVSSLRRLAARLPLYPFELLTYGAVAAIVVVLRAQDLRIDLQSVTFMAGPMTRRLPIVLLWGMALQGLGLLVARRSPRDWWREVATIRSALLWLRVWLAAMAMTYGYSWLKVCVPLVRERIYDGALLAIDRVLHLGVSPSALAVDLLGAAPVARALDAYYGLWLTTVTAAMAWIFLSPRLADRRHFAFACGALWLGGAWIYLAVPAVGPCFVDPTLFDGVRAHLPAASAMQEALARNYATMVAGRDGSLRSFNPYFGVAALPSLHVGAHWLLTLWARRRARRLVPLFATLTILTFVASLVTGWHYAVDGYLGMLLAWAAIRLADRFEGPPAEVGAAHPEPGRLVRTLRRGLAGAAARARRLDLQPVELAAVSLTVATLLFLRLRGLRYGWNTLAYQMPSLLSSIPGLMVIGVAAQLVLRSLRGEGPRAYLRSIASRRWAGSFLRVWLVASLLPYLYTWLKVSVPLLRTDVYDAELWAIDRFLHGGIAPTVFAIELVAGTPVAGWLDAYYALWVPSIPLVLAVVYATKRPEVGRNFAMANVLLWSIGAWLYFLVPVLGPCYFTPDILEPVRDQIPKAIRSQDALWSHYLMMVQSRGSVLRGFSPFFGVAALPSLHVGAYAMFAFWARRHAPRFFLLATTATALIFLGSLVTAWHYAIDGYAAILLAWAVVRLADRWQPVAEVETPATKGDEEEGEAVTPEASS